MTERLHAGWPRVPSARVALIASRGICTASCTHKDCDAARLAREVLERRAIGGELDSDEPRLDGCTCGGIGATGSHRAGCAWAARRTSSGECPDCPDDAQCLTCGRIPVGLDG